MNLKLDDGLPSKLVSSIAARGNVLKMSENIHKVYDVVFYIQSRNSVQGGCKSCKVK